MCQIKTALEYSLYNDTEYTHGLDKITSSEKSVMGRLANILLIQNV